MASGGLYMIHNPWSVVQGGADDMRREADVLDKVRENLARQYAGRKACKLSLSEIEAAMAAETWYTAEEAKAAGLVDEVRGEGAKAMAIPKRLGFKNAPKDLYGKPARGGKVAALEASPALWASRIAQRRQATLRR
jgi:ATP-dependent Clp protease protease subunit